MTRSTSILGNALSASLGLALCGTSAAEPVFPPPHLHAHATQAHSAVWLASPVYNGLTIVAAILGFTGPIMRTAPQRS